MTEDQGTPRSNKVQIRTAIYVDQMLSRSTLNEEWRAAHGLESTHGGIHAARDDAACALVEFFGTRMFGHAIVHLSWAVRPTTIHFIAFCLPVPLCARALTASAVLERVSR